MYTNPIKASALSVCYTEKALNTQLELWRDKSKHIGFVPTMGALHNGHLSLVQLALGQADKVVVSLFVNPQQFAPGEDFRNYPRTHEKDLEALRKIGCHCVFIPDRDLIYPKDFLTKVHIQGLSEDLEGQFRPHFFIGVTTVITKLFNLVKPHLAVFGEKDYQQLCIIKRLVQDLNIDIKILTGKTLRDAEGLALSSRNAYLSRAELGIARKLNKVLKKTAQQIEKGNPVKTMLEKTRMELSSQGFSSLDYLAIRTEEQFLPLPIPLLSSCKARLLVAAQLGNTRLIDNWPIYFSVSP